MSAERLLRARHNPCVCAITNRVLPGPIYLGALKAHTKPGTEGDLLNTRWTGEETGGKVGLQAVRECTVIQGGRGSGFQ